MQLPQETLTFIGGSPAAERIPIELPKTNLTSVSNVDSQIGKQVLIETVINKQIIGIGQYTGNTQNVVRVVSFDLRKEYLVAKVVFDSSAAFSQRPLQATKIKEFEAYVTQVRKTLPITIQL